MSDGFNEIVSKVSPHARQAFHGRQEESISKNIAPESIGQ
jgi:hypothetical protein